jgi:SAM-dependent methyltransferase
MPGLAAKRGEYFAAMIAPYVENGATVLDLGCGDLAIARALRRRLDRLHIVGVDVLAPPAAAASTAGISFAKYDGTLLPVGSKSVDTTYVAFVLHHTFAAEEVLHEAIRVTRRNLVILEDVYTNAIEKALLKFFDAGNRLQAPAMALPFCFRTEPEWLETFRRLGLTRVESVPIRPVIPKPTRHRKFVVML